MAGEPKPWDQLDDETPRDYRRFQAYLRLPNGERTSKHVAAALEGTPAAAMASTLGGLMGAHSWKKRAAAWDEHLGVIGRRAMQQVPALGQDQDADIVTIAQDAARLGGAVLRELMGRPMGEMSVTDLEKVGGLSARMLRALAELGALAGVQQETEALEDSALGRDAALRARVEAHIRNSPPPGAAPGPRPGAERLALTAGPEDAQTPPVAASPATESVVHYLRGSG